MVKEYSKVQLELFFCFFLPSVRSLFRLEADTNVAQAIPGLAAPPHARQVGANSQGENSCRKV